MSASRPVVKCLLSIFLSSAIVIPCGAEPKEEKPKPAQSIQELQQQLEKILKDTHTPGVSLAIVHRDGPEWVAGLGVADVATNRPATADTLFRIGSTSKAFTSMSILLLADQGKLSLNDPVHKLAPEVWFQNPWEDSDPVRVVNLLEHTTGWDDMHLREYGKDAPPEMTLRDALDFDHSSRTSRWRPGTRMAYCNSGPGVASYIVEKISGTRFEDFVQQNLFGPIGMKTATYLPPPAGSITTLYHSDGKTPYSYWNILMRAAGAINASANDMAAYVQFYLNRGAVKGAQVLPAADVDRMESPTSTWAAREGLRPGYGLSNYWSFMDGYTYHGHNGGVEGGLTELAYMPENNVGYFFSINSGNGQAYEQVSKAIRAYITRNLQRPALPAAAALPASAEDYSGWYVPDSPRIELTRFVERLMQLRRVHFRDGQMLVGGMSGTNTFLPVSGEQFRIVPKKDPPEALATTILLQPKSEGTFIQLSMQDTAKRIPGVVAILQILLTVFVVLAALSILIYAPFWILGGFRAQRRRPAERGMRVWPLLAVLSLVAFVLVFIGSSSELIGRLSHFTVWSGGLFLCTIAFAVASLASVIAVWRTPAEGVRRSVRVYSGIVAVALLIATLYLAYYGIIGFRTWV
jgi:CubicO group peptidase (beta-lactamase class C family)